MDIHELPDEVSGITTDDGQIVIDVTGDRWRYRILDVQLELCAVTERLHEALGHAGGVGLCPHSPCWVAWRTGTRRWELFS